jgi:uncharacterized membrane protein
MAKQNKSVANGSDDRKTFAFLATFLSIVGFIIALVTKKDDRYVMFYAKQSLVVFIVAIIGGIINSVLWWIPILGWALATVINIGLVVLWIFSWVYSLSGQEKETPLIGQFAKHFNF